MSRENFSVSHRNVKILLATLAFIFLSVLAISAFSISTDPLTTVGYGLAYTSGVSMIFIPCTFPMVLLIVPLSVKAGAKRGLIIAALFGLGVSISMTVFGALTASIGGFFGINRAVKQVWAFAGVIAYAFGLSQLGLIEISMPFKINAPKGFGKNAVYIAPLVFGLMLGDAGIGCPSPAFYLLVSYIISSANLAQGAALGFLHGFGRATPLIFLAVLGLLGTNVTKRLARNLGKVNTASGIVVLFMASFILTSGLFGDWFTLTILERPFYGFYNVFGSAGTARDVLDLGRGELGPGWQYSFWITMALFAVPMIIWAVKRTIKDWTFIRRPIFRYSQLFTLGIIAVVALSAAYYVNVTPPTSASFEEMKALGFPFKPDKPPLFRINLVSEPTPDPMTVIFKLVPKIGNLNDVAVNLWEWGDGYRSGSGGTYSSHTYGKHGTYTVIAQIFSGGGCGIAPTTYEEKITITV